MRFNGAKARGELGLSSRPLTETLLDCAAWLIEAGFLRPDMGRASFGLRARLATDRMGPAPALQAQPTE